MDDRPAPPFAPVLRDLTHELRNPLSAIATAAEAIELLPGSDEAHELAGMILAETERLERLIANMLDMSRLDGGVLVARPEWVPAQELVAGSLAECRTLLADTPVELDVPADAPELWADPVLTERILVNLLHNAVRHGAPPVLISGAPDPSGGYALSVRDHGPGVDPRVLPVVFEPFVHRPGEGLGIGLPLCVRLAEAQGGGLRHDHASPGARFTLVLPVAGADGGRG